MEIMTTVPSSLALVLRAAKFAADAHRDQRRKDVGATPFINHPLALADILANEGGVLDPEVIVAGLLHDVVEDTETTISDVQLQFGYRVSGIVAEVTDDPSLNTAARKRAQVISAPGKSDEAKQVKISDKIANLRDIAATPPVGWSVERRRAYYEWARDVAAGLRGVNRELERAFDQAYQERALVDG